MATKVGDGVGGVVACWPRVAISHSCFLMADGIFSGVSMKVRCAFFAMTMGAIAVPMLLMTTLGRREQVARSSVFGCYTASGSPALLIRADAIHIIEPAQRTFRYAAEASKTSYQLSVQPALALSPQSDGTYAFVQEQGVGYFWPLLPVEGKNRNRVRHPKEYAGRFEVYAADGARIVYTRSERSDACRNVS